MKYIAIALVILFAVFLISQLQGILSGLNPENKLNNFENGIEHNAEKVEKEVKKDTGKVAKEVKKDTGKVVKEVKKII